MERLVPLEQHLQMHHMERLQTLTQIPLEFLVVEEVMQVLATPRAQPQAQEVLEVLEVLEDQLSA
jgi:hypothetical protein